MPDLFTRTIATSGKFVDAKIMRMLGMQDGFTDQQIVDLHRNTLRRMRTANLVPNIKFGHDDANQQLRGEIKSLKLRRVKLPSGRVGTALDAEFSINRPFVDDVRAGLFPKSSIETNMIGETDDGEAIGEYLMGLALLGRDQPAIAHLPKALSKQKYQRYLQMTTTKNESSWASRFLKRLSSKERSPEDAEEMIARVMDIMNAVENIKGGMGSEEFDPDPDLETIASASDFLMEKLSDKLDEKIDEEGADPEISETELAADESDDEDKEDEMKKDKALAAMQAEIKQLSALIKTGAETAEAEAKAAETQARKSAFDELHKGGKVLAADRPAFDALVKSLGMTAAVDHFKGRAAPDTPNSGSVKGASDYSADETDLRKELAAKFSGDGYGLEGKALEREISGALERRKEFAEKYNTRGVN